MFDFFGELPLAVRFFMAFAAVMGLIGLFAWLVRRFGMNRLGNAAARGRQPRLAVIEHGQVDSRRKLVIVRRDNVEHLIMIGGPTDILIEANIVRGQAASRDTTATRAAAATTTATTTPAAAEPSTSWPLAPEPGTPRPRPAALEESLSWSLPAEPAVPAPPAPPPPPAPRRQANIDPLAGLANELSRPAAARTEPAVTAPRTAPTLDISPTRSTGPTLDIPMPKLDIPAPKPAAPKPQPEAAGDQNLSEMAQRLEAALRRPGGSSAPAAPAKPATPVPNPSVNPSLASAPRIDSVNGALDKAAKPEPAAEPDQGGAAFGSLEQEMANLLGRPTNKQ